MANGYLREYVDNFDSYQSNRETIAVLGGQLLKVIRQENAISLRKFAKEIGVSFSYLTQIGKRQTATLC